MISEDFARGFRRELANRAWALSATQRLARRLAGDPRRAFWAAYVRLEEFNAPRYRLAAQRWGIDPEPTRWTRLRGAVSGSAPRALVTPFLRSAYHETIEYVDELRHLRKIGPHDGTPFLDYVVEQEVLQVEMMRLALAQCYAEVVVVVEEFLLAHRDQHLF